MLAARRNLFEIAVLFFSSLILFTWGLSAQEIFGFDSRFYLFVQEMWRYGASWFPLTYHQPYPDYPASSTFLIYLCALALGTVNKFVVVLPTAILAAATLTITYLIGAMHSKRWGLCAVLFMFLTITFLRSARSISLDMYPTVITACCFYLIYSADFTHTYRRLVWIYPLLILGFAFRGPIGLVMPTGVICSYYFLNRNVGRLVVTGFTALMLLMACTAVLLALAYHTGGDTFLWNVLRMEVLGRINNHYLPRYFYFTDSLMSYALAYPVALLVFPGLIYYFCITREHSAEMKLNARLLGWVMVLLIGMSIPDDKKVRYVLPVLPALALIAAYPFIAPPSQKYFAALRWIMTRFFLILPLVLLMAFTYVYFFANKYSVNVGFHFVYVFGFFALLQVMNIWIFCRENKTASLREPALLGSAALCVSISYLTVVEPVELYIDRARDFVVSTEALRKQQHSRLVFYREKPDGLPIKYLINMPDAEQPVFIRNQNELLGYSGPAFFVTSKSYFNDLPEDIAHNYRIITNDTLGHVPVVVFAKKQEIAADPVQQRTAL
jgi:4-amino-4-deoxy-L-arabinose transferase-like glycosyltransferase